MNDEEQQLEDALQAQAEEDAAREAQEAAEAAREAEPDQPRKIRSVRAAGDGSSVVLELEDGEEVTVSRAYVQRFHPHPGGLFARGLDSQDDPA